MIFPMHAFMLLSALMATDANSSGPDCPPREGEPVPTLQQLRLDLRSPAVVAEEASPDVVLGSLAELARASCASCDEPTTEDLALRGSQPYFLPHTFLSAWRQDCNAEYSAEVRSWIAHEMSELPACSAKRGDVKAEPAYGNGATIGQHLLMVVNSLWRMRGRCV